MTRYYVTNNFENLVLHIEQCLVHTLQIEGSETKLYFIEMLFYS